MTTTPKDEMELRRVLVDELLRTPEKYGMSGTRYNWKRELRLMRHSRQLPCLEVLLAASFLFRLSVFVYFWSTQPVVFRDESLKENEERVLHIQCVGGIHFNPLKTLKKCAKADVNLLECYTVPVRRTRDTKACSVESIMNLQCMTCGKSTHPCIVVSYGEQNFCGILDTGAEVSLIRKSVFNKCQSSCNI